MMSGMVKSCLQLLVPRRLAAALLGPVLAVGCANSVVQPGDGPRADSSRETPAAGQAEPEAGASSASCGPDGRWRPIEGTETALKVDYLAVVSNQEFRRGRLPVPLDERGVPCSGAMDRERCEEEVLAHERALIERIPPQFYLLTTAGDDVQTWHERDAPELLSPIDSPDEALIMLALQEDFGPFFDLACAEHVQVEIARVGDGWRITPDFSLPRCDLGLPELIRVTHVDVAEDGVMNPTFPDCSSP